MDGRAAVVVCVVDGMSWLGALPIMRAGEPACLSALSFSLRRRRPGERAAGPPPCVSNAVAL